MKRLIEVEMGETTCGECPYLDPDCGGVDGYCGNFGADISLRRDGYLRCPACLAKYGTGDQWKGGDPNCTHTPVLNMAGGTFCVICQAYKVDGTGDKPGVQVFTPKTDLLRRIDTAIREHESIVRAQEALSAKPDPRDAVVSAAVRVYKGEEKDFEADMMHLTRTVNDYLCGNPQVDPRDAVTFTGADGGEHTVTSVLVNGREIKLRELGRMDAVVDAARKYTKEQNVGNFIRLSDAIESLDAEGGRG